jgi:hypothetical protein
MLLDNDVAGEREIHIFRDNGLSVARFHGQ